MIDPSKVKLPKGFEFQAFCLKKSVVMAEKTRVTGKQYWDLTILVNHKEHGKNTAVFCIRDQELKDKSFMEFFEREMVLKFFERQHQEIEIKSQQETEKQEDKTVH